MIPSVDRNMRCVRDLCCGQSGGVTIRVDDLERLGGQSGDQKQETAKGIDQIARPSHWDLLSSRTSRFISRGPLTSSAGPRQRVPHPSRAFREGWEAMAPTVRIGTPGKKN